MQQQLRALIAHAAGESIAELIDSIFCSSDFGSTKSGGLFRHVLRALKVTPRTILHIGDNFTADYSAALEAGIRAMHIQQFPEELAQRFRLEASAGLIIDSRLKSQQGRDPTAPAPFAAGLGRSVEPGRPCWLCLHRTDSGRLQPPGCQEQLEGLAGESPCQFDSPAVLDARRISALSLFEQSKESASWNGRTVDLSRFSAFAASFADERRSWSI